MLTKADDFPIHQTPEPIAYSGTDRNFYDRYFFNGYNPDGSGFFAVAFGVYPHLNIVDAHFSTIRGGTQHCVHASRVLNMERWDLVVGPIRIEVIEPLQKLKVTVAPTNGIAAEFIFEGRAFPIEEPRFIRRNGPRVFMDYTRLTQNGRYAGWIEVDGVRQEIARGAVGTRDRSWGVRPIGAPDAQPLVPNATPGFFWQWTPLNFEDRSVFFHFTADSSGVPWNTRAVVCPDGAGPESMVECDHAEMAVEFVDGTKHAHAAVLTIPGAEAAPLRIALEPIAQFQMCGVGYLHPKWGHGRYHADLLVEREDIDLKSLDPNAIENLHIQALCRVALHEEGEPERQGLGVFEQLVLGPYKPYGFA